MNVMETTTYDQYPPTFLVRLISGVERTARRLGLEMAPLSLEKILATAVKQTGLHDFGSLDIFNVFTEVLQACQSEIKLTGFGKLLVNQGVLTQAANRLRFQQFIQRHPKALDTPLKPPLFVIGLPRSGTTYLHELLCQDPVVRVPVHWELRYPIPLVEGVDRARDPRLQNVITSSKAGNQTMPFFPIVHPLNAEGMEECYFLLMHLIHLTLIMLPKHMERVLSQDHLVEYTYYYQLLQVLQYVQPKDHFVLKCPMHLMSLPELLSLFPTGQIVQTHRSPAQMMGSWCSFLALVMRNNIQDFNLHASGEYWLWVWSTLVEKGMAARTAVNAGQFYDVPYAFLLKEPLTAVRGIYTHFGMELTPEAESKMKEWNGRNPQHKSGVHRYSLAQFGLTESRVNQAFANYIERYQIPV